MLRQIISRDSSGKGYRVAICEQTEEAGKGVKLVKREVVRVITPGTAIDPQLVESKETVYLAAICGNGDTYGAAFLELSSGQFSTTQIIRGRFLGKDPRSNRIIFTEGDLYLPRSIERAGSVSRLGRVRKTGTFCERIKSRLQSSA